MWINIFCNLIEPWISGIYAGDLNQLSIKACFPEFTKYEKIYGSLLIGLIAEPIKKPIISRLKKFFQKDFFVEDLLIFLLKV